MRVISEAYKGRIEMLRAILGGPDEDAKPEPRQTSLIAQFAALKEQNKDKP